MTKSNRLTLPRLLMGAATLLAGMASSAVSETITVCADGCDHTSIIEAVAVASDGDVILLAAETFQEGGEIQIAGKRLTITGSLDDEGGPATRILGDDTHRLLQVTGKGASGTLLENISFERGRTAHTDEGGAGLLSDPPIECFNCRFIDNVAGAMGGGTSNRGGGSRGPIHHEGCVFLNNAAFYGGGSTGGSYSNCRFINNRADSALFSPAALPSGASLLYPELVSDCYFEVEQGTGTGSSVVGGELRDCVFTSGTYFPDGGRWERCRFEGPSFVSCIDWNSWPQQGTMVDCYFAIAIGRSTYGCVFEGCTFEGRDPIPMDGGRFDSCVFRNGSSGQQIASASEGCEPYFGEPSFRNCSFSVSCPADPRSWRDLGGNTFADAAESSCPIEPCDLDLSGDGTIDSEDLGIFLSYWGAPTYCDIDENGVYGAAELGVLLAYWGPCP